MSDLRSGSSIGGNLIWHSANLKFDTQGQTIKYAGYKLYSEYDKPTASEVGAYSKAESDAKYALVSGANYVSKAGDTMTGKLTNTANDIEITGITPRLTLTESDQSNKQWFLMADNSSLSIRETNTSTIRFQLSQGGDKAIINVNSVELQAKRAFAATDTWLRINDTSAFTSGVLFGTSLVRTESAFQTGAGTTTGLYASTTVFNWKGNTVWHAGNDGAGSGLDADTVDGIQASALALLSGSTFTGTIHAPRVNATTELQFNGKVVVGGTNDAWMRLNATNGFTNGIYCGNAGVLRHDGAFEIGNAGESFRASSTGVFTPGIVRANGGTSSSWGTSGSGAFDHIRANDSAAHWLITSSVSGSDIRAGIQVLNTDAGNMRLYTNKRASYVEIANGNVQAASFSGSGLNLTSLNASNITSGTLSGTRMQLASSGNAGAMSSANFDTLMGLAAYPITVWNGSSSAYSISGQTSRYPNGRQVFGGDYGILVYADGTTLNWYIPFSTTFGVVGRGYSSLGSISMIYQGNSSGDTNWYFNQTASKLILLGNMV